MIRKSQAVEWVKAQAGGAGYDVDGKYGKQCTDFHRKYTEVVGASQFPALGDHGPEVWTELPTPAGWTKITDVNAGQAGDSAIFRPLPGHKTGHVMELTSNVSNGHFTSVDQNWQPVSSEHGSPPILVNHDNSRVICYYRPHYAAEPVAAPTPPPIQHPAQPAANRFSKLAQPLDLETNKTANLWFINFKTYPDAKAHSSHPEGSPFRAYGMYKHPLGSNYYMNEVDFGNADADGTPLNWLGFNTVDLRPRSAPAPVVEAVAAVEPVAVAEPVTAPADAPQDDIKVNVTVNPANPVDPNAWQASFKTNYAGKYMVLNPVEVKDYVSGNFYTLKVGMPGDVIGYFENPEDGHKLYRLKAHYNTKKDVTDEWVGAPMTCLRRLDEDEDIEAASKEVAEYVKTLRADMAKKAGQLDGLLLWLKSLIKIKNKKG